MSQPITGNYNFQAPITPTPWPEVTDAEVESRLDELADKALSALLGDEDDTLLFLTDY